MKSKTTASQSSDTGQTATALLHVVWCALVALRLAQRDGEARSPLTEHTFLMRWLASAQKQRRFTRAVSPDIDNLLRSGRQKGLAAGLCPRLLSLWDAQTSPVGQQSDLFRLAQAIDDLKTQGWVNSVIAEGEWDIPDLLAEYADVTALLVKKSDLMHGFTDEGQLNGTVTFVVKGEASVVTTAFDIQALRYTTDNTAEGYLQLALHA